MRPHQIVTLEDGRQVYGAIRVRFLEYDMDSRPVYAWEVIGEEGRIISRDSSRGPVRGDVDATEALAAVCSFIGAGIESRQRGDASSENWDLISDELWEWIDHNNVADVITLVELQLRPPPSQGQGVEL